MKVVKGTYLIEGASFTGIVWGATKEEATREMKIVNEKVKEMKGKIARLDYEVIIVKPNSEALVHFLRSKTPKLFHAKK